MESPFSGFVYFGVVAMLLLTGVGLPIPEDIPLIAAGYMCYEGLANIYIMVPLTFAAVILSDLMMFGLGRRYGEHVPRLPIIKMFLTPARLERARNNFNKHGGKAIFTARFLPGVRAATFFTAGTFRISIWRFLAFDGSAALISVPLLTILPFIYGDEIDMIRQRLSEGQVFVGFVAGIAVTIFIGYQWYRNRTNKPVVVLPRRKNRQAHADHPSNLSSDQPTPRLAGEQDGKDRKNRLAG